MKNAEIINVWVVRRSRRKRKRVCFLLPNVSLSLLPITHNSLYKKCARKLLRLIDLFLMFTQFSYVSNKLDKFGITLPNVIVPCCHRSTVVLYFVLHGLDITWCYWLRKYTKIMRSIPVIRNNDASIANRVFNRWRMQNLSTQKYLLSKIGMTGHLIYANKTKFKIIYG